MYNESNGNPIDASLTTIKGKLFGNFVKKWSCHTHKDEHCNKTITLDGNWKISRLKCSYDNVIFSSAEFGEMPLGCVHTPDRKSYYCAQHKSENLVFFNGEKYLSIQPKNIQWTRFSNFFKF